MTNRLQKLETLTFNQREEIKKKTEENQDLKQQLEDLKKLVDDQKFEEIVKIQEENIRLRKQLHEMEVFLNDYGLKWIGTSQNSQIKNDKTQQLDVLMRDLNTKKQVYNYNLPKEIGMTLILKRIEELNIIMEKECILETVNVNGIHKIQKMQPILIHFYKNGILLQSFPFYPYSSKEAQQFLADILDGYFPYQLKSSYPNGIYLQPVDKLDEIFKNQKESQPIQTLGMLQEKLLKKEQEIKEKNIIQVREIAVPTQVKLKKQRNELSKEELDSIATLKIKFEYQDRILYVELEKETPFNQLYKIIDNYSESKLFQISTKFPNKIYDRNENNSLEQLGLYPNS